MSTPKDETIPVTTPDDQVVLDAVIRIVRNGAKLHPVPAEGQTVKGHEFQIAEAYAMACALAAEVERLRMVVTALSAFGGAVKSSLLSDEEASWLATASMRQGKGFYALPRDALSSLEALGLIDCQGVGGLERLPLWCITEAGQLWAKRLSEKEAGSPVQALPDYRFTKCTLPNEWTQVTVVAYRPVTPDFEMVGSRARLEIARFMLSGAAGLANQWAPSLEQPLWDMFVMIEKSFLSQHPELS